MIIFKILTFERNHKTFIAHIIILGGTIYV